jgi:predicted Zn-dependent protease
LNTAVGIGGQGLLLKFSRKQESEADEMGLYLMAMAGYNPEEAVTFWQRMAQKGGNSGWELLSTHPSDQTRINDIKKNLPKAKQYYKPQ